MLLCGKSIPFVGHFDVRKVLSGACFDLMDRVYPLVYASDGFVLSFHRLDKKCVRSVSAKTVKSDFIVPKSILSNGFDRVKRIKDKGAVEVHIDFHETSEKDRYNVKISVSPAYGVGDRFSHHISFVCECIDGRFPDVLSSRSKDVGHVISFPVKGFTDICQAIVLEAKQRIKDFVYDEHDPYAKDVKQEISRIPYLQLDVVPDDEHPDKMLMKFQNGDTSFKEKKVHVLPCDFKSDIFKSVRIGYNIYRFLPAFKSLKLADRSHRGYKKGYLSFKNVSWGYSSFFFFCSSCSQGSER